LASIQVEFANEMVDFETVYGEAYAKKLSEAFSAGIAMAKDSFREQGKDLCSQWAPGDLERLRAIAAGAQWCFRGGDQSDGII
jgi:hypothetical protein